MWAKTNSQKTTLIFTWNQNGRPTSFFDVLDKLFPRLSIFQAKILHFSGKNVRLSSLPSSKTFLKTTEHSWTKTILSRGGRRKLFNSSLTNKFIWIEWVTEWVPFDCLLSSWMLRHPWAKSSILPYKGDESLFCRKLLSLKVVVRTVWNFGGVLGYHPKYFILKTPSGHLNVCKYLSGRRFHGWLVMNKNKPLAVNAST